MHFDLYRTWVSGVGDSYYEYGQMITGGLLFLQGLADGGYDDEAVEFRHILFGSQKLSPGSGRNRAGVGQVPPKWVEIGRALADVAQIWPQANTESAYCAQI